MYPHAEAFSRYAATAHSLAQSLAPLPPGAVQRQDLEQLVSGIEHTEQLAIRLRALRARVLLHTMERDLSAQCDWVEVGHSFSTLAEVSINSLLRLWQQELEQRYGLDAPPPLVVVAMGKLGGRELNASSDIDLVFIANDETSSGRGPEPLAVLDRIGKKLIQAIDQADAYGYVFRVDMRLRPFGSSGPLVASLAMLENYFVNQARGWERYAWIKARALSGREADQQALSDLVRPFVYRRYLDFSALDAVRQMHQDIARDVAQRGQEDIKLGRGGIREIEFIAQVHQLIHGGRQRQLQQARTVEVLHQLAQLGHIPHELAQQLSLSYGFLRNLEHRLQYLDDHQTQQLPPSQEDRETLARAMACDSWAQCEAVLRHHQSQVQQAFDSVFFDEKTSPSTVQLWTPATELAQELEKWPESSPWRHCSERGQRRLESLSPKLVTAASATPEPSHTLRHLMSLVEVLMRKEAYLALLDENPRVLERVAQSLAFSRWGAKFLTRYPMLLDELLDPETMAMALDPNQLQAECRLALSEEQGEEALARLTLAYQSQIFRILNLEMNAQLEVEQISDAISLATDTVLAAVLELAAHSLGFERVPENFLLLAYGKWGSLEMGYGSDLDMVFVYQEEGDQAPERYARLSRRLNHWLSSYTRVGRMFDTDLALRPDGGSGLVVRSFESFSHYQLHQAWEWEHLALTRARAAVGGEGICRDFDQLKRQVVCQARSWPQLREKVLAMWQKIEHSRSPQQGFDLKTSSGGMMQLEFMVQALVLAHAHDHPQLADNKGIRELLQRLAQVGLLSVAECTAAQAAYRSYRQLQHRAQLDEMPTLLPTAPQAEAAAVRGLWQRLMLEGA